MSDMRKKVINFDLSDNALKRYYPSKLPFGYKRAWADIGRFMRRNGFEHRQYLCYVSKVPMSYARAMNIVYELSKQYPWLHKCAMSFDMSSAPTELSVMPVINAPYESAKIRESEQKMEHKNASVFHFQINDLEKRIQKAHEEYNTDIQNNSDRIENKTVER